MRIYFETLVSAGDMSGNINSNPFQVDHQEIIAVQPVWTGTPTGTIKLQACLDNTNWVDISGATASTGGTAGTTLFNITDVGYRYLRAVYTKSSGTGTLTVYVNAKGV